MLQQFLKMLQAEKRCYAKLGFYFEKYQKIKNKNNKKIIPKTNLNVKNNKNEYRAK